MYFTVWPSERRSVTTVVHTNRDTRSFANCRRFVFIAVSRRVSLHSVCSRLCAADAKLFSQRALTIRSQKWSPESFACDVICVCYRISVASCCGGQFRILTTRRQITAQCVCPRMIRFAPRAPKRRIILFYQNDQLLCADGCAN